MRIQTFVFGLLSTILVLVTGCPKTTPRSLETSDSVRRLSLVGIFYGWPSLVNGAKSTEEAAEQLSVYDVLVLGWGLQRAEHGDHQSTRKIIAALQGRSEVYGYIPLGSRTNLSLKAIKAEVAAWKALGVGGIFFDEAGFDFGNTRRRQNKAFTLAHKHGLRVFANAFNPADLFASRPKTTLRSGDCYLYESFALILGTPEDGATRQQKLLALAPARKLGIRLFGVTTSKSSSDVFDRDRWREVVALARRANLDGIGWGAYLFGAADNVLPPALPLTPARR